MKILGSDLTFDLCFKIRWDIHMNSLLLIPWFGNVITSYSYLLSLAKINLMSLLKTNFKLVRLFSQDRQVVLRMLRNILTLKGMIPLPQVSLCNGLD